MRRLDRTEFDVIVFGSGLAGSFASIILARKGYHVLMLDKGVHPRFAIGESTIPQTSMFIELMARKYDVPEFSNLGNKSPTGLREAVGEMSGIKRVVGFAYHELGKQFRPEHGHHFGNVWRDENHIFRQDVDAWLMLVAMKYGCRVLQGTQIQEVSFEDSHVTVAAGGKTYRTRFVIDATGFRSVIADKLDLREQPCSLAHSSRTIFNHAIDVKDIEEVAASAMAHKYSEGTLHNVFKRGWFWVIPFGNWEGAKNPLVSVGLTLDDRVYPEDPELTAEEEFEKFLEMVPTVSKQFADAQAVRPWVRTKRIQYASKKTVGKRFALLSHAAGFVDPLYSRGLISTVESVDAVCDELLAALEDDDFTEDRFKSVERQDRRNLDFADKMVHASYASWDDFDLWNLWVRVWAIGVHVIESNLGSVLVMGSYSRVKPAPEPVVSIYEDHGYRKYFTDSYEVMKKYDAGELSVEQAKQKLASVLEAYQEFRIPLLDNCQGQEWAMRNPDVRDIFLGIKSQHERWVNGQVDKHLMSTASSSEAG